MHSFLPKQGASMRWAVWAAAGLLACGSSAGAPGGGGNDAGSGAIGTPDAGDGTPDAGAPDAGTDAGYTGLDCAGIVPAKPGSGYTFDAPAGACSIATSDGKGAMAALAGQPPAFWEYDARGAPAGNFDSSLALPQAVGFIGVVTSQSGHALAYFDESGNTVPGLPIAAGAVVTPAWHGGALVFSASASGLKVALFDSGANQVSTLTIAGSFTALGGVQDAAGKVLALAGGVSGIWVDLEKGTSSGPFALGSGSAALARSLAGGGVAVRIDGRWTATLQPGDATLHAAPAWLSEGDDFQLVRGEKAYAIVQGSGIDLVSTQGNLCGSMSFKGQGALDIGLDGTVIGSSGAGGCTKVFWPGLLK